MKVLMSNELLNKIKLIKEDDLLIAKLNNFISSVQNNYINVLSKSNLIEKNIYVYKLDGIRLFYSLQKDNEENIVIVILDFVHRSNLSEKIITKNPKINNMINPKINNLINPKINNLINPKINNLINPKINNLINPKINNLINPKINNLINPKINNLINPKINKLINPKINNSINPNFNPSFEGLRIYSLDLDSSEFMIKANDQVQLIFNNKLECTKFAVDHKKNGYVVFNFNNNEWIEHMQSNGSKGYNHFSLNNDWIGFAQ